VKLSIGDAVVVEPTLRGWKLILSAVPESVLTQLMEVARKAAETDEHGEPKREALSAAGFQLLSLLRAAPDVLAALCQAVVRLPGGKMLDSEQAWALSAADADDVLAAIAESTWLPEFLRRLKNRLSGSGPKAGAPASTPT